MKKFLRIYIILENAILSGLKWYFYSFCLGSRIRSVFYTLTLIWLGFVFYTQYFGPIPYYPIPAPKEVYPIHDTVMRTGGCILNQMDTIVPKETPLIKFTGNLETHTSNASVIKVIESGKIDYNLLINPSNNDTCANIRSLNEICTNEAFKKNLTKVDLKYCQSMSNKLQLALCAEKEQKIIINNYIDWVADQTFFVCVMGMYIIYVAVMNKP